MNYQLRARIRPARVNRTTSKLGGWQISAQATDVNRKMELKPHALYVSLGQRVNIQNHDSAAFPQKTDLTSFTQKAGWCNGRGYD